MPNAIRDPREFLVQARESLAAMNETAAKAKELSSEVESLEKSLDAEQKAQASLLETTIKKRRDELSSTYDTEISRTRGSIQKEKARRDKAVAAGKKERSRQETQSYTVNNKELKKKMREMFRTAKMPAVANTTFYYSLFGPGSFLEVLIFIISLAVVLAGIPLLVYHLLPWSGTITLVLIYVIDVLFFGAIYLFINNSTKVKHREAFLEGKRIRKQIRINKKESARIERGIKKDKDESYYDLESYDTNLKKLKADLEDVMARRTEAMENFEEITKQVITEEIEDNGKAKLNDLQTRLESARSEKAEADYAARNASLGFTDTYGAYIDREFWNEDAINAFIGLIDSGEAKTVTDTQTIYRKRSEEGTEQV